MTNPEYPTPDDLERVADWLFSLPPDAIDTPHLEGLEVR